MNANSYRYPPISLLRDAPFLSLEETVAKATETVRFLADFLNGKKLPFEQIDFSVSPTFTSFYITPAPNVRVKKLLNAAEELPLTLFCEAVRAYADTKRGVCVYEIPNSTRRTVYLRQLLEAEAFQNTKSPLLAAFGVDKDNLPIYRELSKLPHLLLGGVTGAGKSVCLHSILLSLLYRARPNEVQLILIDPKRVELNAYNAIPHLALPLIRSPKEAVAALQATLEEMEARYQRLEEAGVRNLQAYNDLPGVEKLPYLVVAMDELADLMLTEKKAMESLLIRLVQKARATGIYLILGTQRPRTDVLTGLIRCSIPSRIAFKTTDGAASRAILDTVGAEKLLGHGDALFSPVGELCPMRLQTAYVSDSEAEAVCEFLRAENGNAEYAPEMTERLNRYLQA